MNEYSKKIPEEIERQTNYLKNKLKEDILNLEEEKIESKINEELEKLKKRKRAEYAERKRKLENEIEEKLKTLGDLKERIEHIRREIEEDEETYALYEKIRNDRLESEKESKNLEEEIEKYRKEKEKFIERNKYLNLTKEELEEEIENKIRKERKELEKEYEELIFAIEKENRAKIRKEQERQEIEEEKLRKEFKKKFELLNEKYEEARKEKEDVIQYLGFSEFIEKKSFLFRDKIEAYLILSRLARKKRLLPVFKLNEFQFITVYKNVVMTINELIRLNNENIDLKIKLGKKEEPLI